MKLKDKVALVTGSSMGIGESVAKKFAEQGASLVINSRSSTAEGERVVDEIREKSGKASYVRGDVTNEAEVEMLFRKALELYGTIDILVNNAGNPEASTLTELDKKSFLAAVDSNLTSTVLCSLAAAKIMKTKQSATIINTSSVRGIDHAGREGILGYSAAKAAVNNFTRTLAKQLAPNITVNAIAPGFVRTNYMKKVSEEMKTKWLEEIPISRFIEPDELAEAYLLLANSSYFTGTILVADGGFTLKLA